MPYIADAWVTLKLAFGLGIQNGAFVAVAPSSNGTVEFDTLTSFFGGILLGLALALNNANERATQAGDDLVEALIRYINIVELHPSGGKLPRYAVVTHRDGRPLIGYVECSVGPQGVTVVLADRGSHHVAMTRSVAAIYMTVPPRHRGLNSTTRGQPAYTTSEA